MGRLSLWPTPPGRPCAQKKVFSSAFFFFSWILACAHAQARDQIDRRLPQSRRCGGGDSSLALAAARAVFFYRPPQHNAPITVHLILVSNESRQDDTGYFGNSCQNCIQTAVCVWGESIRHVRRWWARGGTLWDSKKKKSSVWEDGRRWDEISFSAPLHWNTVCCESCWIVLPLFYCAR